jgi:hypothetical protein
MQRCSLPSGTACPTAWFIAVRKVYYSHYQGGEVADEHSRFLAAGGVRCGSNSTRQEVTAAGNWEAATRFVLPNLHDIHMLSMGAMKCHTANMVVS